MDGGLQTNRTGLNVASKAEGVVINYSLELILLWVVRVVHRTVVTELARRNDGFTPGKRSQPALRQSTSASKRLNLIRRLLATKFFFLHPTRRRKHSA